MSWSGAWFEGISYLLEKGKDVQNFNSIEKVFHIPNNIDGIKFFHSLGLPWCSDSSRNTHLLSKIACYNDLEDVKWAYENGCKGGDPVPYVEKEWESTGIRSKFYPYWRANEVFFEENGLLSDALFDKNKVLCRKNVQKFGDSRLCDFYVQRKDAFPLLDLCSLKKLVDHGYKFLHKTEQEYVCKEAYKKCCEDSQNEDHRKRLAIVVGMGNRDQLRKRKVAKTKGRKKKSASLSLR